MVNKYILYGVYPTISCDIIHNLREKRLFDLVNVINNVYSFVWLKICPFCPCVFRDS